MLRDGQYIITGTLSFAPTQVVKEECPMLPPIDVCLFFIEERRSYKLSARQYAYIDGIAIITPTIQDVSRVIKVYCCSGYGSGPPKTYISIQPLILRYLGGHYCTPIRMPLPTQHISAVHH